VTAAEEQEEGVVALLGGGPARPRLGPSGARLFAAVTGGLAAAGVDVLAVVLEQLADVMLEGHMRLHVLGGPPHLSWPFTW
jgi:hypothetical protein